MLMVIVVGNVGQPMGQLLKKKMRRCLIISDLRIPPVDLRSRGSNFYPLDFTSIYSF